MLFGPESTYLDQLSHTVLQFLDFSLHAIMKEKNWPSFKLKIFCLDAEFLQLVIQEHSTKGPVEVHLPLVMTSLYPFIRHIHEGTKDLQYPFIVPTLHSS